jgi:hypothetical protein
MPIKLIQPRYSGLPRALRQLPRGKVRAVAARAIEREVVQLIDERFVARAAPDATPWAPRKQPTGTWPLLEKTGKMRRGFKVMASATQLKVTQTQDYLKYHQKGTERMVARPVFPDAGLPAEWTGRIDAAVARALGRALG